MYMHTMHVGRHVAAGGVVLARELYIYTYIHSYIYT